LIKGIITSEKIFITIPSLILLRIFFFILFDDTIFLTAQAQMNDCIAYSESEKLIIVTCEYATFSDISNTVKDPTI